MNRTKVKKFFALVGMVLIAALFFGLGLWQWDRAQENRKPVVIDQKEVSLASIANIGSSLAPSALLRNVVAQGRYIEVFEAPHQFDIKGRSADWEVALLSTAKGAILVVRGLWSERSQFPAKELGEVEVRGRLMPHQYEDTSAGGANSLQRIDSSVIVDKTTADLLDGYIVATSENVNGATVGRDRIAAAAPRSAVPGFYWQHISYVIIWWLMALIVLYLPFYQRRVTPENN